MIFSTEHPLGVISLGGSLPLSFADRLQQSGTSFHCIGFDGLTDPALKQFPHTIVPFFKVGGMIRALRAAGCKQIVATGQFFRPNLFKMRFDATTLRYIPLLMFARSGGDDSVLRRVTRAFESEGFEVISLKDIAPSLVAQEGLLGR
ncbi:MAG: hypothetical protein V4691_09930, partial [Pseudomonadota bacterium]